MTQDVGSSANDEPGDAIAVGSGAVATVAPGADDTPSAPPKKPKKRKKRRAQPAPGEKRWAAGIFLLPAAVFLFAIVLYPFVYTVVRSFYHDGPSGDATGFAGWSNYTSIFSDDSAFRAFRNNLLWVLVAPAVATMLGLIFAVLTERIRWASAFKIVLFMPLAVSFVAVGVTWGLVYADQPSRGLANAVTIGVHNFFKPSSGFPELHPTGQSPQTQMSGSAGQGYTSKASFSAAQPALLPLAGFDLQNPPSSAEQAATPSGPGLHGTVWNDFALGGGGKSGVIDKGELGVPGMPVQAVQNGQVVASTTTGNDGSFSFPDLTSGSFQLKLPSSAFAAPFGGVNWLGRDLITWSIMIAYLWMYTGFCMVLLAAGMAAIPRDALEAARMDGATEFQVFRRVTAPLLAPVLMVVFVTMVINVLKIFDIVWILGTSAGGDSKYADVLAVLLYNDFSANRYGAASAVGVVLMLLVIPAMIFQIWRFRRDQR